MYRNRWIISLISMAFVATLVVVGATMRPTASASPAAQLETATATETPGTETPATTETPGTETPATTETPGTETPVITETPGTETPVITDTPTPIETLTPTATPFDITPTASPTPGAVTSRRFWSYAAKFVCGEQTGPISGTLALGSYATEINIHNPFYRGQLSVYRQALLLISDGQAVGRAPAQAAAETFSGPVNLSDGSATLEDCASIWELKNPGITPPEPMPLMVGYLVIVSPRELDVVSVLTSAPADDAQTLAAPALSTLNVPGKRAMLPSSAFPGGILPPDDQFVEDARPLE